MYYSKKSKGMRKKAETDDAIPSIAPGEPTSKQFRRRWAMLIQKIYEVDPLCCPNCQNQMRIVSILEAVPPVKKILEHLDLWETRNLDPPNEDLSHILRTRLRRFGLPNPAIRLLGLSPSLSEKKIETGIGAGLRPETGRFPCFSRFFRLPQTMFNSSAIFAHSSSDSTTARPSARARPPPQHVAAEGGRGRTGNNRKVRCSFVDKKRVPIFSARPPGLSISVLLCVSQGYFDNLIRDIRLLRLFLPYNRLHREIWIRVIGEIQTSFHEYQHRF